MPAFSAASRRRFLPTLSGVGLGSSLLPGILWAQMAESGKLELTTAMIQQAAALAGLSFTPDQCAELINTVSDNLGRYEELHAISVPNDVAPPFYFSPIVAGMTVDRIAAPVRFSSPSAPSRPANLEDLAFASVLNLAALIKSSTVTSVELTRMFLIRLRRLNSKLNCVVTFLDDLAFAQAKTADAEIAAGHYRGPLHGIPWGAKDIIAVAGYKTTWGSGAYQDQEFAEDATVTRLLREAGAVLIAKLTTGELAGGNVWFGGRTNNPWKLDQGSSGSSAGPASATAAGCVPFSIGSETSGSIFSPSSRCGATGLYPTFGRVSRVGVMALSWTQDRLGPICRYVEDCAVVIQAITPPDSLDLAMQDIPFNWDATADWRNLRIGYLEDAFADTDRNPAWIRHDRATLNTLREMGADLIPLRVPEVQGLDTLRLSAESAVFFDDMLRSGRDPLLTVQSKAARYRAARLIPAVEYQQSQRIRAIIMAKLSEATAKVDVYVAPYGTGLPRHRPPAGTPRPPPNATSRHTTMANLATYPGIALPNDFTSDGTPSSITFMGRPYGEAAVMSLAKAYQDATTHHLKQPAL
ncbi:MAG: amidase [Candidatus Synoicihabitans palmerolidicus]|nr:amidase [Candidatus Synoicihabitans palmerolidicus]